jgi:hypothetical protein
MLNDLPKIVKIKGRFMIKNRQNSPHVYGPVPLDKYQHNRGSVDNENDQKCGSVGNKTHAVNQVDKEPGVNDYVTFYADNHKMLC